MIRRSFLSAQRTAELRCPHWLVSDHAGLSRKAVDVLALSPHITGSIAVHSRMSDDRETGLSALRVTKVSRQRAPVVIACPLLAAMPHALLTHTALTGAPCSRFCAMTLHIASSLREAEASGAC